MSREYYLSLADMMADAVPEGVDAPDPEDMDLGVPEATITTTVDVTTTSTASAPRWPRTRARSRPTPSSSCSTTTRSAAPSATEWFIRLDETPPTPERWIFWDFPAASGVAPYGDGHAGTAATGPTTRARTAP